MRYLSRFWSTIRDFYSSFLKNRVGRRMVMSEATNSSHDQAPSIEEQRNDVSPEEPRVETIKNNTSLHLDFEAGDLSFWTAEGDAFQHQPIRGDRFVTSQARPGLISIGGDYWDGPYPVG